MNLRCFQHTPYLTLLFGMFVLEAGRQRKGTQAGEGRGVWAGYANTGPICGREFRASA